MFCARCGIYRIGTRINIDVLNAQQQLFAAQRDLFKARVDTLMQGLRLKAAAGSLHDGDIQFVNTLLAQALPTAQAEPQTEGTKP
jgi:outer membrane protein